MRSCLYTDRFYGDTDGNNKFYQAISYANGAERKVFNGQ